MRSGWSFLKNDRGRKTTRLLFATASIAAVTVLAVKVFAITWSSQTWDLSPSTDYTVSDPLKIEFLLGPHRSLA